MRSFAVVAAVFACFGYALAGEQDEKEKPHPFLSHPAFTAWWSAAKEKADLNGDGRVDTQELAQHRAKLQARRMALRQALLERFDADGDGRLSGKELEALRVCLATHPVLRERLRWRWREEIRERSGNPFEDSPRCDGDTCVLPPPGPARRWALADRLEDVRDRREDIRDRLEDVRDRREDAIDRRVKCGPRDVLEDILDALEDIRDRREDARDILEDRIDPRRGAARERSGRR